MGSPLEGAIDLQEEEMEQSVSGLTFTLDPSAAALSLHLSPPVPFHGPSPPPLPSCHRSNRVRGSVSQESAPKSLPQWSVLLGGGCLQQHPLPDRSELIGRCSRLKAGKAGLSFSTVYDSRREPLRAVPPQIKTLGLFLNMGGGALSFHNPLTKEHLATLPTRFSNAGVRPALGLGQGRLRLRCGLPPLPHVFLSQASAYRGPSGAGWGRWHRYVPFQSVGHPEI
ncbi:uncharacterized protein LOC121567721 isoform X2 [Coregonus clupeaformis]|nr:uncharacterized protein LOC121567721 isoform X2 [Coregonus clupeaformis]XP_045074893.1 uncharacterized protein LOC121567721 isoform X2 [Coregonus clupeaformis]XP_045074896.1 uncharacterized protein LOC121567721 isoform X2 [Coregonus clupeaformis]